IGEYPGTGVFANFPIGADEPIRNAHSLAAAVTEGVTGGALNPGVPVPFAGNWNIVGTVNELTPRVTVTVSQSLVEPIARNANPPAVVLCVATVTEFSSVVPLLS